MRLVIFVAFFCTFLMLANNSHATMGNNVKLPVWFNKNGLTTAGQNAMLFLKTAEEHGIDPYRYNVKDLEAISRTKKTDKLLQINNQVTHSLILYLLDLKYGVQGKKTILNNVSDSDVSGYKEYFASVLYLLSKTNSFDKIITSYINEADNYWKLQKALVFLQDIQKSYIADEIKISKSIRLNESDGNIPLIRKKLAVIESLSNADTKEDIGDTVKWLP